MIIAPNSRAHKGKKERGEVKGEYGGVCGQEEGNADYGEWCNPVSNMLHHVMIAVAFVDKNRFLYTT